MPLGQPALDTLTDQLVDLAAAPASVTMPDGRSFTEQKIGDVIAAHKFLDTKAAMADPATGRRRNPFALLRRARVVPPGAI